MASRLQIEGISPDGIFSQFIFPEVFRRRIKETRFSQEWKVPGWKLRLLKMGWNGEGDPMAWLYHYMRSFNGPKYQRGMLSGFSVKRALVSGGENVVLTNHTFSSTDLGNLVISRAVLAAVRPVTLV